MGLFTFALISSKTWPGTYYEPHVRDDETKKSVPCEDRDRRIAHVPTQSDFLWEAEWLRALALVRQNRVLVQALAFSECVSTGKELTKK